MPREIYNQPPANMLDQLRNLVRTKNTAKHSGKGRIQLSKDGKSLVYTKRNGVLFKFFAKAVNLVYKKKDLCDHLGIGDSHRQHKAAVFFKQLASQQRDINFEIDKNTMNVAKLAETFKKFDLAQKRDPVRLPEVPPNPVAAQIVPADSIIAPPIAKVEKSDVLETIFRNCGNDRNIHSKGDYATDLLNLAQINISQISVEGNTGLRLVYNLWQDKLDELNLDKDQHVNLLANMVSGSKKMLYAIINNPELAKEYLAQSDILAGELKNCIVRNSGAGYATEQRTSSEAVEMTGNFIDFAAKFDLFNFTSDRPPVMLFSQGALFPALMSAVSLQRDSLETLKTNIAAGGGQVLKNMLAATGGIENSTRVKLDTIPEQNRKDQVFALQCQMDPLRGVLDYAQIGGLTSGQNRQGTEFRQAGETFLLAVNAFVDQKGYRAVQAQSDPNFYNYKDLYSVQPNCSIDSFIYCTGYTLDDFESPDEVRRASQMCQSLAAMARSNGLHVETYIKAMKDVIWQHAKAKQPDENLLDKYGQASEQAKRGFVKLSNMLITNMKLDKQLFMETYLREVALPLTSFALDVAPTPDLDQMTEIATKYLLWNIDIKDLSALRNSIYNVEGGVHEILACSRYIPLQDAQNVFDNGTPEQRLFDKLVRLEPLRVLAKEVDKAMESRQIQRFDSGRDNEWLDDHPYNKDYVDGLYQNRKVLLEKNSADVVSAINSGILTRQDSVSQPVDNESSEITPTAPPPPPHNFDEDLIDFNSGNFQSSTQPYNMNEPELPFPVNSENNAAIFHTYAQPKQAETGATPNPNQSILSRYSFPQVAASQRRSGDDETNRLLSAAPPDTASPAADITEEVANMALIYGGTEYENISEPQKQALTDFYLIMRDCALAGKTDINDLVGGNVMIVKALLANPALHSQMTEKLNEAAQSIAALGTAENLDQAASALAGCVARIGEFESACRAASGDENGDFNSETLMRAAAHELLSTNPGALRLFSEKLNQTDFYSTIFIACVQAEGKWGESDTELLAVQKYTNLNNFLPLVAYAIQAELVSISPVLDHENYCLKLAAANDRESRGKIVQESPADVTDQLIADASQAYKAAVFELVVQAKDQTPAAPEDNFAL